MVLKSHPMREKEACMWSGRYATGSREGLQDVTPAFVTRRHCKGPVVHAVKKGGLLLSKAKLYYCTTLVLMKLGALVRY